MVNTDSFSAGFSIPSTSIPIAVRAAANSVMEADVFKWSWSQESVNFMSIVQLWFVGVTSGRYAKYAGRQRSRANSRMAGPRKLQNAGHRVGERKHEIGSSADALVSLSRVELRFLQMR